MEAYEFEWVGKPFKYITLMEMPSSLITEIKMSEVEKLLIEELKGLRKDVQAVQSAIIQSQSDDVDTIEACRILKIKNPRLLKSTREKGWFGLAGDGYFSRGKNFFYRRSVCESIKLKLDKGELCL